MDFFDKYRNFLYFMIRTAHNICMCLTSAAALLAYPAYSPFLPFTIPDGLTESLLTVCTVLTLCRALVSVDSSEGIETTAGFFLSCGIFAAAYHFRNAGGFAIKGYIFSFASLTTAPYRIPNVKKADEQKNKARLTILFTVPCALFAILSAILIYTCIFRAPLTAAVVIRLCGYPMLILLPAAVCMGMKRGFLGRMAFYSAWLLSLAVAAFVFVTSFEYSLTEISCTVLSLMLVAFLAICTVDALKKHR